MRGCKAEAPKEGRSLWGQSVRIAGIPSDIDGRKVFTPSSLFGPQRRRERSCKVNGTPEPDLDQADRGLPHPNDSRQAPACFDRSGKTDPDMLVGGLFPREDQRSTRTDVTKVSRNGVKLIANPPAHVGFIPGGHVTGRCAAFGRTSTGGRSPQSESTSLGVTQPRMPRRRFIVDIVLKNVERWRGNRPSAVQSFMRHVGSDGLTHKTEKSLSRESGLAIHGLFDPGLESVADETGYQPPQRNMLLRCEFAKMAEEIIGQQTRMLGLASIAILRLRSAGGVQVRLREWTRFGQFRACS